MCDSEKKLLMSAALGNAIDLNRLLALHRARLKRMIMTRLDPRLQGRLDASDVVQEVHFEVSQRFNEYLKNPDVPFFNWIRFLAKQKMAECVRRNINTQMRDVRREESMANDRMADSSIALTRFLIGAAEKPSAALDKEEVNQLVAHAIESMSELDREILLMRHVEQLSTEEAATELGISVNTCRQRHLRALQRLRELMADLDVHWSGE